MRQILQQEIVCEKCNAAALGAFNAAVRIQNIDAVEVRDIFNDVKNLNPKLNSYGVVEQMYEQMSESERNKLRDLLPKESIAYKILTNPILNSRSISKYGEYGLDQRRTDYTDKQLWAISYELMKNKKYTNKLGEKKYSERIKAERKKMEQKTKLSSNKSASQPFLDMIKQKNRKLGDYYKWLNTRDNKYRKEYFNKKYSLESVKAFLGN